MSRQSSKQLTRAKKNQKRVKIKPRTWSTLPTKVGIRQGLTIQLAIPRKQKQFSLKPERGPSPTDNRKKLGQAGSKKGRVQLKFLPVFNHKPMVKEWTNFCFLWCMIQALCPHTLTWADCKPQTLSPGLSAGMNKALAMLPVHRGKPDQPDSAWDKTQQDSTEFLAGSTFFFLYKRYSKTLSVVNFNKKEAKVKS